LQVILGILFPITIVSLDFKSKEELQLLPQTVEEHVAELEDAESDEEEEENEDIDALEGRSIEVPNSASAAFFLICLLVISPHPLSGKAWEFSSLLCGVSLKSPTLHCGRNYHRREDNSEICLPMKGNHLFGVCRWFIGTVSLYCGHCEGVVQIIGVPSHLATACDCSLSAVKKSSG